MHRHPLLVLLVASATLSAGCGDPGGTGVSACATSQIEMAGWRTVAQQHAVLRVPPEYILEHSVETDTDRPRGEFARWIVPPTDPSSILPARTIVYHWGTPVPLPGGYRAGSELLQEHRECEWTVQGRTARVVAGWLPDDRGKPRTYHTVAAWSDVQPGVHLMVFTRAESAAEQERLFAVLRSLRFR